MWKLESGIGKGLGVTQGANGGVTFRIPQIFNEGIENLNLLIQDPAASTAARITALPHSSLHWTSGDVPVASGDR